MTNFPRRQLADLHHCVCWHICRNRKKKRTRQSDHSDLRLCHPVLSVQLTWGTGHPKAPPSLSAGSTEYLMFKALHPCWSLETDVCPTEISRLEQVWRLVELKIHWISTDTLSAATTLLEGLPQFLFSHREVKCLPSSAHQVPSTTFTEETVLLLLPDALRDSLSTAQACHLSQEALSSSSSRSPAVCPCAGAVTHCRRPRLVAAPSSAQSKGQPWLKPALLCKNTRWTMPYANTQEKSLRAHARIKACEYFNLHVQ